MSFLVDDDDILKVRPHRRKVRGGGRRGTRLSGSLLNKWNFAEGSRAAVFKKIPRGGTHTRQQLRRQMDYINTKAQYTFGYSAALTDETRQPESALAAIASKWEQGWRRTPENGHTSHLLLSFPPDTAPRDAAAIAEEMCERAFGGEKEFADDRWEYIAALHTDRSHPHVHVLVNNRGVEHGTWFYLSSKPDAPFTYQGFRNLMVSVAQEYGVRLEATTRYERGDLQYSPSGAQWRLGRVPGSRVLTDHVLGGLIDEADEWAGVAKAAKLVGNERVAEVADRMIQGIVTQSPMSRKEIDMVLETVETPEEFGAAITGWAERMRDKILALPPEMQGRHFTAVGAFLGDLKRDYGFGLTIDGIEHPGPIASSLHVDRDLLVRRAEDYVPQGRQIDRPTIETAVEMFSTGAATEQDILAFAGDGLTKERLDALTAALCAIERAQEDYSFAARPGAVAAFWRKFGQLSDDAGIDPTFAKGVFENDLLDDTRKVEALASAANPERSPKISAEDMFIAVQAHRDDMRANVLTPDIDYLASFMRRLPEREYPSSAPSFANPESEREYAAALRAHFGSQGLSRMAEGDYRDLEAITPNRLHQRELAASVMAMAERPDHAEKLGLTREEIAAGYEAADEHHKARRVLGITSTGDDFSL